MYNTPPTKALRLTGLHDRERTIFRGESTSCPVDAFEAEITVSTPEASPLLLAFYYCASWFYSDNGSGVVRGRKSYFTPRGKSSQIGSAVNWLAAVRRPIIIVAYAVMGSMGRCVLFRDRSSGQVFMQHTWHMQSVMTAV